MYVGKIYDRVSSVLTCLSSKVFGVSDSRYDFSQVTAWQIRTLLLPLSFPTTLTRTLEHTCFPWIKYGIHIIASVTRCLTRINPSVGSPTLSRRVAESPDSDRKNTNSKEHMSGEPTRKQENSPDVARGLIVSQQLFVSVNNYWRIFSCVLRLPPPFA